MAFLDEPTIGLDVLVKQRVREHLIEMRRRFGTTIVLTTHDLKDISETCERLLVLDKGQLLYDGDVAGFETRFGGERDILAELNAGAEVGQGEELTRELAGHGAELIWEGTQRLRVVCSRPETVPTVTRVLLERLSVRDLTLKGADIDSLVTRIYRSGAVSR
ncbi:MAG: hypothetical protein ABI895_00525 [Deltaproteobacteria bacterium]